MIIYWRSKNLTKKEIQKKCQEHFHEEAPPYSTITRWVRLYENGIDIFTRSPGQGRTTNQHIYNLIKGQLESFPFHSLRSLSTALKIPKSTIHDYLRRMGYVIKCLRYVPHKLTDSQKVQRVEISIQLLKIIKEARHQSWAFFLTGDETWIYYENDY